MGREWENAKLAGRYKKGGGAGTRGKPVKRKGTECGGKGQEWDGNGPRVGTGKGTEAGWEGSGNERREGPVKRDKGV